MKHFNIFLASIALFFQYASGAIFVSPSGNDTNAGTISSPFYTIAKAVTVAAAGDTIFVRGGTYYYSQTILLSASGTANARINIWAYQAEKPVLDFSAQAYLSANRGIQLNGDYWYIRGLEIYRAGDNGIKIEGSHNKIELCVLHHNRDSGIQIGFGHTDPNPGGQLAAYNEITKCDSYRNFDSITKGGNADGFACKMHNGIGNVFSYCRAWENSDDGWDLYETDWSVSILNCWTWHNGDKNLFPPMSSFSGNGNGFKLGGNGTGGSSVGTHIVKNCVAFNSNYGSKKGFDQNSHKGGVQIHNCTAFGNGYNFMFEDAPNSGVTNEFKNCVEFAHKGAMAYEFNAASVMQNNSWNLPAITVNGADFLDTTEALAKAPREADGSLPNNNFARLVQGSDLIDQGVNVGLPYSGAAPDLGAFEYTGTAISAPSVATATITNITQNTAAGGGTISSDGGAPVTARGVCWSTAANPTVASAHSSDGTGTGAFTSSITGLVSGTLYHVRAYATNSAGTSYGSDYTFTTLSVATIPVVSTSSASGITQTTASVGGNVSSDGGSAVTARGVCWGTSANPSLSGTYITAGSGTGSFSGTLSGLTPGTLYHIRSYATNGIGTAYGADLTFTTSTSATAPVVSTASTSGITVSSANSGGVVSSDGGSAVTARGVCWAAAANPTISDSHTSDGTGTGTFSSSLSGLSASTTYHVRAYATNSIGTSYGGDSIFTTQSPGQNTYWATPEGFEPTGLWPTAANPTPTNVTSSTGTWTLINSYRTTSTSGLCAGSGGVADLRIGKGQTPNSCIISPTLNSGVGTLSFIEGRGTRTFTIHKSTDNGTTWILVGTVTSVATKCVGTSVVINDASANKIKITNATTQDEDIDNISITTYSLSNPTTVDVTVLPQGYYNQVTGKMNCADTFNVYLMNISSPYAAVDSAKINVDSVTFTGRASFSAAPSGNYYLALKHRNSIETWSQSGGMQVAKGAAYSYNFTDSASKAYGTNMIRSGTKWCVYSGDVTQDGIVDFSDITVADNDSYNFTSGYVPSDVNGDGFVDFSDITIIDNNAFNFVGVVKPGLTAAPAGGIKKAAQ